MITETRFWDGVVIFSIFYCSGTAELQLCHFVKVFLGQTLSTNIILGKLVMYKSHNFLYSVFLTLRL